MTENRHNKVVEPPDAGLSELRVQPPRGKLHQSSLLIALLMMVFGFILISHIKSVQADITTRNLTQRYKERQIGLQQAEVRYQDLLAKNETLNQQKTDTIANLLAQGGYGDLLTDLGRIRALAGFTEVRGVGIILTLGDNPDYDLTYPDNAIIHDTDILNALELLRNAGAAAVSINGVRFVNSSSITCIGPTIRCNRQRMTPPYVITALGDPAAMIAAIREDPVFSARQSTGGILINIEDSPEVVIPPFSDADNFSEHIDLLEVGTP